MSSYKDKKSFYSKVLTIYGRNAVMEALADNSLNIHRLHLSTSNKPSPQLSKMEKLARQRGVEIKKYDKKALSRISKNAKQDQGVALDIILDSLYSPEEFIDKNSYRIIALDRVTNPQNVGMIIRSAAAGNIDAILIPKKGTAPIVSPLTIKASVGTIFKIPIIYTENLKETLLYFKTNGASLYTLDADAKESFRDIQYSPKSIFILGNESEGVSSDIANISDNKISIPMNRGVESLNVAVTASLLAFLD